MRKAHIMGFILIAAIFISAGCGKKQQETKQGDPQKYLPQSASSINLERSSEIRTFEGQSLWEYIDGGAELYYTYDFLAVATADYTGNHAELLVDIYQFGTADYAFGLYSMLRGADAQLVALGVEGFTDPLSITFVKGEYVVRLIAYEETDDNLLALTNFADELAGLIPGTTSKPDMFSLFPDTNAIIATDRLYAEAFLGSGFLTDVFCRDFALGIDTVTLFVSRDETGAKYIEWANLADSLKRRHDLSSEMPFDEDYGFMTGDSFYGPIMVGLKNNRLMGLIGTTENAPTFLKIWLESMP
ncbi:MAG: hypothetical protein JW763_05755 [candidate division Zixibacteria bacterium]|nr:hypothetical protein [candidate division Zixibacteria bacterium]